MSEMNKFVWWDRHKTKGIAKCFQQTLSLHVITVRISWLGIYGKKWYAPEMAKQCESQTDMSRYFSVESQSMVTTEVYECDDDMQLPTHYTPNMLRFCSAPGALRPYTWVITGHERKSWQQIDDLVHVCGMCSTYATEIPQIYMRYA